MAGTAAGGTQRRLPRRGNRGGRASDGPLRERSPTQAAIGDVALDLWEVLKWPVAAASYLFLFVALSSRLRDDRADSPWEAAARSGAALAWVVALGVFAFYLIAFDAFADS